VYISINTHFLRFSPSQLYLKLPEMSEQYSEDAKHIEKLYEFDERLSESTDKSQVRLYFT